MFVYVASSDFKSGPQGGAPDDAVAVFDLNPDDGSFKHVQTLNGLRNPTYLARHPKLPILYAIERWINPDRRTPTPEQQKGDCVSAFAIDPSHGGLTPIGQSSTGGPSPMHVNAHPNGQFLFFANPGLPGDPDPDDGHMTVMRLKVDGSPGDICASVKYPGRPLTWRHRPKFDHSPIGGPEPKAYPHSVFSDPSWTRVFVPNLMADRIRIYRFDAATGALSEGEQPHVQVSTGAGPRHMAFHPNGRFFFVINEFDATVSAFNYDLASGFASIVQTISIQPLDFSGRKSVAHILVGPGGRFLYCSNRTHKSIAIFAIEQQTGELRLIRHQSAMGDRPRDFIFDPSGRLFLLANQHSSEVVSFHVDPDSGDLRPTGHTARLPNANCVVFGPQ